MSIKAKRQIGIGIGLVGVTVATVVALQVRHHSAGRHAAATPMVYTREGYGGYVAAEGPPTPPILGGAGKRDDSAKRRDGQGRGKSVDPLAPAEAAYTAGKYHEAEVDAQGLLKQTATVRDPAVCRERVEAQMLAAYAAAHRHDLRTARERFAMMRQMAADLPDHGARPTVAGEARASLEDEAAFQHAVCTGALGDKRAAEAEYKRFICNAPDSPLMQGAMLRIRHLHGGHIPADAEALWRQAMARMTARRNAAERERSLCGPACLAELLRRRGKRDDVHMLADEMHTSHNGTTMQALADAAKRHGYAPRGLELSTRGLLKQRLPLVALESAGHYVLVDAANPTQVRVWDPDAKGTNRPGTQTYAMTDWERRWNGAALVIREEGRGKREE